LEFLRGVFSDGEGVAQNWFDPTDSCNSEVSYNWATLHLHNIVNEFRIHSLAESGLTILNPRYTTSVTIATLATLQSFESRAFIFAGADYDYTHISLFFLGWLFGWFRLSPAHGR
jgi:hypothetical protein